MREDMFKVIVERPRRGKYGFSAADRCRNDFDGPTRLGMRAGYGYRDLNENLAPLRRYLHAQIGRPWNKVFSEICAGIDRRSTVQQHIHQHIGDFIAIDVGVRNDRSVDLAADWKFLWCGPGMSQALYVDPRTGLIRPNKNYRSHRHGDALRRQREQLEIAARRRVVDERTLLLLLDDLWFRVEVEVLPKPHRRMAAESRHDVVLRRTVSRAVEADVQICKHLYGSGELYAVGKRQISTREIKAYRLR